MSDEEFENTDAGASKCEKVDSNRLKNGSLVMIKGNPCKVTEVSTAKPGKHGSAKVILKGRDILTAKTYECTYHAGDMVDAPITSREAYLCLSYDDTSLSLLNNKTGEMKDDVNFPEAEHLKQVGNDIKRICDAGEKECLVTVLDCMGTELAIEVREGAAN